MRSYAMIIMLLLVVAAIPLCAENNSPSTEDYLMHKGFGAHFGYVSGNGYSYRLMNENYGWQLVLGGATTGNDSHYFPATTYENQGNPETVTLTQTGRKYYSNVGLNFIYTLKRTHATLFYLHAGANWKYSIKHKYYQEYEQGVSSNEYVKADSYDKYIKKSSVNFGAGPGFEFALGKYIRFAVEVPLTISEHEVFMYVPQAGIYYYFK